MTCRALCFRLPMHNAPQIAAAPADELESMRKKMHFVGTREVQKWRRPNETLQFPLRHKHFCHRIGSLCQCYRKWSCNQPIPPPEFLSSQNIFQWFKQNAVTRRQVWAIGWMVTSFSIWRYVQGWGFALSWNNNTLQIESLCLVDR